MKKRTRVKLADSLRIKWLIALTMIILITPAHSNLNDQYLSFSFNQIEVESSNTGGIGSTIEIKSNGSEYTEPVGTDVYYTISGKAKVPKDTVQYRYSISGAYIGIGAYLLEGGDSTYGQIGGSIYGVHASSGSLYSKKISNPAYTFGEKEDGDNSFNRNNEVVKVPLGSSGLGAYAATRCNVLIKNALSDSGMSDDEIFSQDREIEIDVAFHYAAHAFGVNPNEDGGFSDPDPQTFHPDVAHWEQDVKWFKRKVVCLASPQTPATPQAEQSNETFKLLSATFNSQSLNLEGDCPVQTSQSAIVYSNFEGPFQARIETAHGWTSSWVNASTDTFNESTGLWSGVVNLSYLLPEPGGISGNTSGGGGAQSFNTGSDLAVNVDGGEGLGQSGGANSQGMNQLGESHNNELIHSTTVKVVAKAGGSSVSTAQRPVSVQCDAQTSGVAQGATQTYSVEHSVIAANIEVIPKPQQCGVEVKGKVETDHNNVNVNLALQLANGDVSHTRTVTTKQTTHGYIATFSEYFDMALSGQGMTAIQGENGVQLGNASDHIDFNRSGSYKIVTSSPTTFESNTGEFNFSCLVVTEIAYIFPEGEVNPSLMQMGELQVGQNAESAEYSYKLQPVFVKSWGNVGEGDDPPTSEGQATEQFFTVEIGNGASAGSRDDNEPGLGGVVIYSDLNNNGELDDGEEERPKGFGTKIRKDNTSGANNSNSEIQTEIVSMNLTGVNQIPAAEPEEQQYFVADSFSFGAENSASNDGGTQTKNAVPTQIARNVLFKIVSPAGRLKQARGNIRLSSASLDNQGYSLEWRCKGKKGFVMKSCNQGMPRQMKGSSATFELLEGDKDSTWELVVCAKGKPDQCEKQRFSYEAPVKVATTRGTNAESSSAKTKNKTEKQSKQNKSFVRSKGEGGGDGYFRKAEKDQKAAALRLVIGNQGGGALKGCSVSVKSKGFSSGSQKARIRDVKPGKTQSTTIKLKDAELLEKKLTVSLSCKNEIDKSNNRVVLK